MLRFRKFRKRLKVEFSDGQNSGRGFTTDISEDGLFINCRKPIPRGTKIDLTADLPGGKTGRIKARVMVAKKQISGIGEGSMEVEITLYNKAFLSYLHSVVGDLQGNDLSLLVKPGDFPGDIDHNEAPEARPEIVIPKKPESKPEPEPEPEPEPAPKPEEKAQEFVVLECGFCGTKNRVPEDKMLDGPICAMCKENLLSTS